MTMMNPVCVSISVCVCVFSLFFQTCCVSMSKPVADNKLGIYVCILIKKKAVRKNPAD